nr:glycosyltransferase [Jiella mangrovi]
MLKDGGRLEDAMEWYQSALTDQPDHADTHLQIGHALKLSGRRSEALASYRRVLVIDPDNPHASWELIQAGEIEEQVRGISAQMTGHGLETMLSLSAEVEAMRRRLSEIAGELPDIASLTAFPASSYRLFRQLYDVPPQPPDPSAAPSEILVVADATGLDAEGLHRLVGSLVGQSLERWRAVLIGVDPALAVAVERLARVDGRLEMRMGASAEADSSPEWAHARQTPAETVVLLARVGALHRHALAWFSAAFAASEADVVTCDEEWILPGESEPTAFEARGRLDPDMLLSENSWGATIALRNETLERLDLSQDGGDASFTRSDLLLSAVRADASIGHVPLPLVSFVGAEDGRETAMRAARAGHRRAVERHLGLSGLSGRIDLAGGSADAALRVRWRPDAGAEKITVIVPTRDNVADCKAFVDSLFAQAARPEKLHCQIIDNGTTVAADLALLEELAEHPRVRVRRDDGAFNWSHVNNLGAEDSDTPLVVFANDDMLMRSAGWDETLRGLLAREDVGAVGAKLLYGDDTVQHAGVLFGWKGSVIHDGLYEPADRAGPSGRWTKTRRASAVTGAFLAMRRADFVRLGGFDARRLPVGYSDIDLCLRVREQGLAVVFTPDVTLYHHESKSRGLDHLDPERAARSRAERTGIEARWGKRLFSEEPTVSPIWIDATLPYRLISFPAPRKALDFIRLTASTDSRMIKSRAPAAAVHDVSG